MNKKNQRLVTASVLILMLCMNELADAQQNNGMATTQTQSNASKNALYKSNPVWKDMINDPNANFFEVKKAFELFWEGRELPMEEDDIIGENHRVKDNFLNRILNAKEIREQKETESLVYDYKRYCNWLIMVEPYVQDDGRILSDTERIEIWKKHYQELQQQ
jgi:hypothetical protein